MKIYLNKLKDEKSIFWYLVDFFNDSLNSRQSILDGV